MADGLAFVTFRELVASSPLIFCGHLLDRPRHDGRVDPDVGRGSALGPTNLPSALVGYVLAPRPVRDTVRLLDGSGRVWAERSIRRIT
jgi:hypothetical protein